MINKVQINTQLNCLVFKTNVESEFQASQLIYVLEKVDEIIDWNLDMEDWENILKIEFASIKLEALKQHLSNFNIEIEELPIW